MVVLVPQMQESITQSRHCGDLGKHSGAVPRPRKHENNREFPARLRYRVRISGVRSGRHREVMSEYPSSNSHDVGSRNRISRDLGNFGVGIGNSGCPQRDIMKICILWRWNFDFLSLVRRFFCYWNSRPSPVCIGSPTISETNVQNGRKKQKRTNVPEFDFPCKNGLKQWSTELHTVHARACSHTKESSVAQLRFIAIFMLQFCLCPQHVYVDIVYVIGFCFS